MIDSCQLREDENPVWETYDTLKRDYHDVKTMMDCPSTEFKKN